MSMRITAKLTICQRRFLCLSRWTSTRSPRCPMASSDTLGAIPELNTKLNNEWQSNKDVWRWSRRVNRRSVAARHGSSGPSDSESMGAQGSPPRSAVTITCPSTYHTFTSKLFIFAEEFLCAPSWSPVAWREAVALALIFVPLTFVGGPEDSACIGRLIRLRHFPFLL